MRIFDVRLPAPTSSVASYARQHDQSDAMLSGNTLSTGFDGCGLLGAGKPGQIIQNRHFPRIGLGRDKGGKTHGGAGHRRNMREKTLPAAPAGLLRDRL